MAAYTALSADLSDGPDLPASAAPPGRCADGSVAGAGVAPPGVRDNRAGLDEDIAVLDLASISYLAVLNEHWDLEKVDAIELEYRCWLQCVRDHPDEVIVPSFDCDLYWHQHVLHLGLYLEQTRRLFGRVLLHYPFSGLLGEADAAVQEARFLKSRRIVGDLVERVRRTCPHTPQLENPS